MKALLISLITLIIATFMFSSVASAASIFPACDSGTATITQVCQSVHSQEGQTSDPILVILKTVIEILSWIIGIASIIVLIIASLQLITGGSDPQTVKNAKNMIVYALVGIAIAVLSGLIVVFVLTHVHIG